jgi:hypothetical protein
MMKSILSTIVFMFIAVVGFSQARMIFDGTIGIAMSGGTSATPIFVVIDNPNANAITDAGAPGGPAIRSENEYNIVKWNIKNSTGLYQVPFINPLSVAYLGTAISIDAAGDPSGYINFSAYHTPSNNLPWPDGVMHLSHYPGGPESTLNRTMDRFWVVDSVYTTTKP